jgi:SAM-dependent methyltransferase
MFFADPVAAFKNIRRAMKPNGRLLLAVFRSGPENPWATAAVAAIRHLVPPPPPMGSEDPGQFSWSDPARVRRILDGTGFRDVVLTPLDLLELPGHTGARGFALRTMPRIVHAGKEQISNSFGPRPVNSGSAAALSDDY